MMYFRGFKGLETVLKLGYGFLLERLASWLFTFCEGKSTIQLTAHIYILSFL
jgi:hypothetical protein